jgi:hypothetical protein
MKKILLVMLAMILLPMVVFSSDWSLNAKGGMYFPNDKDLQSGKYVQVDLQWKNVYLFGQYIPEMERRIAGQRAGMLDIWSVGMGIKFPINQYLKVYGQFGYYIPTSEMSGGKTTSDWSDCRYFREAQWLYWKNWGSTHGYDVSAYQIFEYKIKSALGAGVGLEATYPLSKHWSTGMNFGSTYLRFQETFYARNVSNPLNSYIQTRQEKDFGGLNLGINLEYKF